jgi:hypothetical protein
MTEAAIVRAILAYLNRQPHCYARKTFGGPQSPGWPDVVCIYHGRAYMLEVKRPGCKLTNLQAHELERWARAGAVAAMVTSVQDVAKIIGSP